jgi:putative DNA primase/helicase
VPSSLSVTEAISTLVAQAARGPEYQAAVRIGGHNESIYVDLGTRDWNVAEINAKGWQLLSTGCPVRFVRPRGLRPLPTPVQGGDIHELRKFLNVGSDGDFTLIVAWLVAAMRPQGPYPVLIVNGEHGSAKSFTCRILRRLIDPNAAEIRSMPRDERDLMLAARNGWVVALDNLSYVKGDLSDGICRIATKGAFATRALYTDGDEFFIEVCRPIILNGIPALASRPDLADRAIVIVLPTIPETARRSEEELYAELDEAAPRIFGALLDGLSGALH